MFQQRLEIFPDPGRAIAFLTDRQEPRQDQQVEGGEVRFFVHRWFLNRLCACCRQNTTAARIVSSTSSSRQTISSASTRTTRYPCCCSSKSLRRFDLRPAGTSSSGQHSRATLAARPGTKNRLSERGGGGRCHYPRLLSPCP